MKPSSGINTKIDLQFEEILHLLLTKTFFFEIRFKKYF